MRVVGSVLVRNEDGYLERAIRNVAGFCDRIHVLDHQSRDRTPEILGRLAEELDHLEVERSASAEVSHRQLQPYVGTDTWVLGVDGDVAVRTCGRSGSAPRRPGGVAPLPMRSG